MTAIECSIDGCTRNMKYVSTGWCQTHYHRFWRTGTVELVKKMPRADLTYWGAHGRVKDQLGSATKHPCIDCADPANEWSYDGTDESECTDIVNGYYVTYSVWPEFYAPKCFACHRMMDGNARAARSTHCSEGHAWTEENVYKPPGRGEGYRECRACRAIKGAASYRRRKALKDG